jgi:hypothetical protein
MDYSHMLDIAVQEARAGLREAASPSGARSSTRRAPSSGQDTTSACNVMTRRRTPKSRHFGTQAGGAPTATRPSRRRWLRAGSVAASSASSGSARSSSGSRARFGEGSTGSVNAACTSSTSSQMSASRFCGRSSPTSPRRGARTSGSSCGAAPTSAARDLQERGGVSTGSSPATRGHDAAPSCFLPSPCGARGRTGRSCRSRPRARRRGRWCGVRCRRGR